MNIFYLAHDSREACQYLVNSHAVKMVLETAQLLSTAHRVLDGTGPRHALLDHREDGLYKATHINHPDSKWVRASRKNYDWLWKYFVDINNEYSYRYGKTHKCASLIPYLYMPPTNIPDLPFTQPPQCMPAEFKRADTVEAYRAYYREGKKHLHAWKSRPVPSWI